MVRTWLYISFLPFHSAQCHSNSDQYKKSLRSNRIKSLIQVSPICNQSFLEVLQFVNLQMIRSKKVKTVMIFVKDRLNLSVISVIFQTVQ